MTNEAQATLFEIDVSSNFALTPVKDPMFPKTPIFLKTVSYCEDEAEAWRRQIKVGNTCQFSSFWSVKFLFVFILNKEICF